MLKKQQYSRILLSRYIEMEADTKMTLMESLILANEEVHSAKETEYQKLLDEWATTIAEIIFPDLMGTLHMSDGKQL